MSYETKPEGVHTAVAYISIGNTDDKLSQAEWSEFCKDVHEALDPGTVIGKWFSLPHEPWQNACWCIGILGDEAADEIRDTLARLASRYRQDAIVFAVADVEFIKAETDGAT